jgi:hypothetical protein
MWFFFLSALLLVTMLFDFFSLVFYSWQQCFVIFLIDLFKIALLLVTVLCDFLFESLTLGDSVMWFSSWVLYSWGRCYVIYFFSALLLVTMLYDFFRLVLYSCWQRSVILLSDLFMVTMFCDFLLEWFTLDSNVLWFSSWVLYSWQQCSVILFLSALLLATMFYDFL